MPRVTVVIPVFNRQAELGRVLRSVVSQTFLDWECLVVDDASPVDLRPVVEAVSDSRIHFMRRDENGGPSTARYDGFAAAKGEFVINVDSDWTLYPWALAQGVAYLDSTPQVDLVTGLFVRDDNSRLFVRVRDAPRVVTPAEFREELPIPDRLAMWRVAVSDEWLAMRERFFASEQVFLTRTSLAHSSLVVDEPWALYFQGAAHSVLSFMASPDGRARILEDDIAFLEHEQGLISDVPCVAVDRMLEKCLFELARARRREALDAARMLRKRGRSPARALLSEVQRRVGRRIRRGRELDVVWC